MIRGDYLKCCLLCWMLLHFGNPAADWVHKATIALGADDAYGVAFGPEDSLIVGSNDGNFYIYVLENDAYQLEQTIAAGSSYEWRKIVSMASGDFIAAEYQGSDIVHYTHNGTHYQLAQTLSLSSNCISDLDATPDGGQFVISCSTAQEAYIYAYISSLSSYILLQTISGLSAFSTAAAIADDGSHIAIGLVDGDTVIYSWNQANSQYESLETLTNPVDEVGQLALTSGFVAVSSGGSGFFDFNLFKWNGASYAYSSGSMCGDQPTSLFFYTDDSLQYLGTACQGYLFLFRTDTFAMVDSFSQTSAAKYGAHTNDDLQYLVYGNEAQQIIVYVNNNYVPSNNDNQSPQNTTDNSGQTSNNTDSSSTTTQQQEENNQDYSKQMNQLKLIGLGILGLLGLLSIIALICCVKIICFNQATPNKSKVAPEEQMRTDNIKTYSSVFETTNNPNSSEVVGISDRLATIHEDERLVEMHSQRKKKADPKSQKIQKWQVRVENDPEPDRTSSPHKILSRRHRNN